jgi:hypothetical protein
MRTSFGYKGYRFYVEPCADGETFRVDVEMDGRTITSTTRTKLMGIAERRAHHLIDSKLREKRHSSNQLPALLMDNGDKRLEDSVQALYGAEEELMAAIQKFVDAQEKSGVNGLSLTSCANSSGRRARKKQRACATASKSSSDPTPPQVPPSARDAPGRPVGRPARPRAQVIATDSHLLKRG